MSPPAPEVPLKVFAGAWAFPCTGMKANASTTAIPRIANILPGFSACIFTSPWLFPPLPPRTGPMTSLTHRQGRDRALARLCLSSLPPPSPRNPLTLLTLKGLLPGGPFPGR